MAAPAEQLVNLADRRIICAGPSVSSKGVAFCQFPGFGHAGTRCIVNANHFLAELSDKEINQYVVIITPEVRSRGVNSAIIAQLVRLYGESELGMWLLANDGRRVFYTAGSLPFDSKEFVVKLVVDDDGTRLTREGVQSADQICSSHGHAISAALFEREACSCFSGIASGSPIVLWKISNQRYTGREMLLFSRYQEAKKAV